MSAHDAVHVEVTSPPHFDRSLLVLRLAFAIVLGAVGITGGWLAWFLFGALPVFAAIAIASRGTEAYAHEVAPRLWRVLAWLLQLSAFMLLLVDRFPTGEHADRAAVRLDLVVPAGKPTVASALVRLLTSIPSALVLALFSIGSCVLWLIAAVMVLVGAPIPHAILAYQRGVLRWQARLAAYHASLIDEYPSFVFETDDGHPTAPPSTLASS